LRFALVSLILIDKLMSKLQLNFKEELQLLRSYIMSAFSKKNLNHWLCLFAGLPLLYLYDHPLLIINIFK
jgi:hypothetical protein